MKLTKDEKEVISWILWALIIVAGIITAISFIAGAIWVAIRAGMITGIFSFVLLLIKKQSNE